MSQSPVGVNRGLTPPQPVKTLNRQAVFAFKEIGLYFQSALILRGTTPPPTPPPCGGARQAATVSRNVTMSEPRHAPFLPPRLP